MPSQPVKIVCFVPESSADAVRKAMGDAGAGRIGHYAYCSFSIDGTGRFKPTAGANPTLGTIGSVEQVSEERIECVCERSLAKNVLQAIRMVHPYEEVGFDIYPLIAEADL
jgi:hypothetical protein